MKDDKKEETLNRIMGLLDAHTALMKRNYLSLSWEQIGKMKQAGWEFGAHTVTHPILTNLGYPEMEAQLKESKRVIEEKIGVPEGFSYPNGDFNDTIKKVVKRYYGYAVSMNYGYNSWNTDLFELRRIGINNNFSFIYFVLNLYPDIRNSISKILDWLVKK